MHTFLDVILPIVLDNVSPTRDLVVALANASSWTRATCKRFYDAHFDALIARVFGFARLEFILFHNRFCRVDPLSPLAPAHVTFYLLYRRFWTNNPPTEVDRKVVGIDDYNMCTIEKEPVHGDCYFYRNEKDEDWENDPRKDTMDDTWIEGTLYVCPRRTSSTHPSRSTLTLVPDGEPVFFHAVAEAKHTAPVPDDERRTDVLTEWLDKCPTWTTRRYEQLKNSPRNHRLEFVEVQWGTEQDIELGINEVSNGWVCGVLSLHARDVIIDLFVMAHNTLNRFCRALDEYTLEHLDVKVPVVKLTLSSALL